MRTIDIALGVIQRDNTCLITQRLESSHLGGLWEFPGGKVESGESPEAAMVREIWEELAIAVQPRQKLMVVRHAYPDRIVRLHCFLCEGCNPPLRGTANALGEQLDNGQPIARQAQEYRWVEWDQLGQYAFPEANTPLLRLLATFPLQFREKRI